MRLLVNISRTLLVADRLSRGFIRSRTLNICTFCKVSCNIQCRDFAYIRSMASDEPTPKKAKLDDDALNIHKRLKKERDEEAEDVSEFKFNKKRVEVISKEGEVPDDCDGIVYWMSRDQRVQDNWALLFAQRLALKNKVSLHVVFCLVPKFLDATIRHFHFMLRGLEEVEKECKDLNIEFHLLLGEAKDVLPTFIKEHKIGGLVTDFSPLRVPRQWLKDVKKAIPSNIPMCKVDAHNIVPCWITSDKQEYSARTIRKKIHDKLPKFLTKFPPVAKHRYTSKYKSKGVDWVEAEKSLEVDQTVKPVDWATPGTRAGLDLLNEFCLKRLRKFAESRNDPTINALSNLSPWLHFGQISAQRCVLEVKRYNKQLSKSVEAYVEEAVVRRELSDNYCFYQKNYDNLDGAYEWARKTLEDHRNDKRPYIYTRETLEEGKTHDELWNSAQIQLVTEGKMHGFLRMYWAKKILEWMKSPDDSLATAIYLNDKYSLDGRDPNGYVGCMWSICGIHDQGWGERQVFGKIRYMNYDGCKRKFKINAYVARYGGKQHRYIPPV
ncbi:deoxyribodipyrimidine photo-lyase [Penaeus vannamei]|uniref:deoxyribodipyrimidine photo-lyase n=1 Tax=Penaeus vannamei TaxID=6689 RepID=UPI00387FAD7D